MRPGRSALPGMQLIILALIILTATLPGWWSGLILLPAAGFALWLAPGAVRAVVNWRWLLIIVLLILPSLLWVGNAEPIAAGIPFSTAGLILGLQMACRATAIYIAVGVFSQTVSVTDLTIFFERLGLRGVGFALGVGFHALPTLRRRLVTAYAALRLRGGFRRQRWRAIQLLLTTLILGALRYGEDVVMAAEARGFQPDQD